MDQSLDSQRLDAVFQSRPDIIAGIKRAADSPGRIALFNEIATHVYEQLRENGEPAQKRRRVETNQPTSSSSANGQGTLSNAADEEVLLEVKEISVSVPQRKKFELCFTESYLYARAPSTTAPIPTITYAWRDIEYIFYLPVPDKAQVQHNYIFFPRGTCLPSKTNPTPVEPLVFTVPSTAPKQGTIGGSEAGTAAAVADTFKSLFHWVLDRRLKAAGSPTEIVSANPNKFQSVIRQPHRPNEKAVHVNAFRGSKDGHLFFLENGILWGYKKPLIFIPVNRVAAVSYTNILQITFNIVVEVFSGDDGSTEELEFGMLDQRDYNGIDDYIKRNRLQDRSMADQRKAKLQLAENRAAKKEADEAENGDAAATNGEGNDMTELERAQMELEQNLQDEEDEDEEDYDPGSEGESEGSGSSSDEDDDDDDDAGNAGEEDAEGEEDEAEGEEEEEEEEEKVPQRPVAKVKVEEKKPKPVIKQEKPLKTSVPVRQGWATISRSHQPDDVDMEDEKFDVVG